MPSVVTLSGSPAERSRSTHLLAAAEDLLRERGIDVHRIDIRQLPATALVRGDVGNAELGEALNAVEHAQAVVIATPLYKSAYSGLLKIFLDVLPQAAMSRKPILPLATGGSVAHLLALDYALRPVLASLGAQHILSNVFASEQDLPWTEGGYLLTEPVSLRLFDAIDALAQVIEDADELRRFRTRDVDRATSALAVGTRPIAQRAKAELS